MSRFHLFMAVACVTVICVSVPGCVLTHITASGAGGIVVAIVVILAVLLPLPVYWHEKGNEDRREAVLVLLWTVVLAAILRYPLLIGARLRMPLRDAAFAGIDRWLGFNVSAVMEWAARCGWVGTLLNRSYALLLPLLLLAIFLPALAGRRRRAAQEFLAANCIAFAIAVPLFVLFPAVGPWAVYHFPARPDQQQCENLLLALRTSGTFLAMPGQDAGIMCFPSFHVIWAVLSVRALWGFRRLRFPVSILAGLISVSTMTTGWHYFVDVLGGLVVAEASILITRACLLGRKEAEIRKAGWNAVRRIELEHCQADSVARQISRQT
jgi:PAP2 superfamily